LGTLYFYFSRTLDVRKSFKVDMKKGISIAFWLVAFVSFGQQLEIVERIGHEQIKLNKFFGSESFFVEVSHLKVSELTDVDAGSISKKSSQEFALLQFQSTKSEAMGVSYGAATSAGRSALGLSLNTKLTRNSGTLYLDSAQSSELSKAINDLFVAFQTFKIAGNADFAIRLMTSFGLELTNDGDEIGLLYDGMKYIIPESELKRLYSVISKVE
jgi:hypothetical protein